MIKRKDMFGVIPEIGDTIVFNPPYYKGLVSSKVIGFAKSGLPEVESYTPPYNSNNEMNDTPKTGFVVITIPLTI
jgi:signal peptidase I